MERCLLSARPCYRDRAEARRVPHDRQRKRTKFARKGKRRASPGRLPNENRVEMCTFARTLRRAKKKSRNLSRPPFRTVMSGSRSSRSVPMRRSSTKRLPSSRTRLRRPMGLFLSQSSRRACAGSRARVEWPELSLMMRRQSAVRRRGQEYQRLHYSESA